MKAIALAIAMAGLAMAANAAIAPATAAAAPTEPSAAEVNDVAETAATVAVLPEANVAAKAAPNVGTVNAVGESGAAKANQPVELTEARAESKTAAGTVGEVKPAAAGEDCSLVGMYSRCRLLSGPWSVKRRLEAARIRGDTDEEERLKTLLDEMVDAAIEAEEGKP